MSSKPTFFFSSTQSVDDRLGDVFSFIWASYAGLRELWWQVRGFNNQFPELQISEVEKKFLSGLPLPGGIDFKHTFLKTDWGSHEQEFSKWLLFEACTLYEGWCEKVCRDIFPSRTHESFSKALQFPSGRAKGKEVGLSAVITAANANKSNLMDAEFFPNLKKSKLNCWADIDSHLVAYRYFKECRNSLIHSDGIATQDVIDWHGKLVAEQTKKPLPFRHAFCLPTQTLGAKIDLNLKDCILFATLVRRLICTLDASLSVASTSEKLLENRLKNLIGVHPKWNNLPTDLEKKKERVHRILAASRIPEPVNFSNVMSWMTAKGLIQ